MSADRTPELINQELSKEDRFPRLRDTGQRAVRNFVIVSCAYFSDPSEENFARLNNPTGQVQIFGVVDMAQSVSLRVSARIAKGEAEPIVPRDEFKRQEDEDAAEYLERVIRTQHYRMFGYRVNLTTQEQHDILISEIKSELVGEGRGDDIGLILDRAREKGSTPFTDQERRFKK